MGALNKIRNLKFRNDAKGFTLAEVLITLGIIGIVAALTIPTLLNKSEDMQEIAQLKKSFSTLSHAYQSAIANEGALSTWCPYSTDAAATSCVADILQKYLKVTKRCDFADVSCLPSNGYKKLANSVTYDDMFNSSVIYQKLMLIDGSSVYISAVTNASYNGIYYLSLYMDTNGLKGPNRWGYDLFWFLVYTESADMGNICKTVCPAATDQTGTLTTCRPDVPVRAYGCGSWAIYKGNMDYKRRLVNWDTDN